MRGAAFLILISMLPLLAAQSGQAVTWDELALVEAVLVVFPGLVYWVIPLAIFGMSGTTIALLGAVVAAIMTYFLVKLIYYFLTQLSHVS